LAVNPPVNSFHAKSRKAWRAWLEANHRQEQGVWVITYKKATGLPRLDYVDVVEEALCFGWIDSKPGKLDGTRSMLWCAPRNAGSGWSRLNKERANRLITAGLMTNAGVKIIKAAKKDGTWTALDAIEALEIPNDLQAMFAKYPKATANFASFPRFTKRAILEWINAAKRPETRAKRVEETAALASDNIRAHQWRK
jgi:uncharacterized protein YdeI (YjbR/CyaY-like superfamily)